MIHIVHCGIGNVGSMRNMLHRLGLEATLATDPEALRDATRLVLPGVGAFGRGMEELHRRGFVEVLNRKVLEEKVPILGVCLGMQLFTRGSEEGGRPGLGWVAADTVRMVAEDDPALRFPHMGWNSISPTRPSALFRGLDGVQRFYFVHSYRVRCDDASTVAATSRYGGEFACAVEQGNIYGTQFHPEKSHRFGMQVLHNFAHHC